MHSHSDKLIKTCPVCQQAIKDIRETGKKLDETGTWTIPKKLKKGEVIEIWKFNPKK